MKSEIRIGPFLSFAICDLPFAIRDLRLSLFEFRIWPLLAILFAASLVSPICFAQKAEPPRPAPLDPVQAEKEAKALVNEILTQKPDKNSTNLGLLKIRDAENKRREIPVRFEVFSSPANWVSIYKAAATNNTPGEVLVVTHVGATSNHYELAKDLSTDIRPISPFRPVSSDHLMTPFTGSDFWLADLGLEFFHWPKQRLLKKELRRGQSCAVLESVNPQAGSNGYSRSEE